MSKIKYSGIILASVLLFAACNGRDKTSEKASAAERRHFPSVEVPAMMTDALQAQNYYLSHYWDAFLKLDHSASTRESYSGVPSQELEQAVCNYVSGLELLDLSLSTAYSSSFAMAVEKTAQRDSSAVFYEGMMELLEKYLYDPNSPYRDEDIYCPILSSRAESAFTPDDMRAYYRRQAAMCDLARRGSKAPDFRFRDIDGKDMRLYGVSAPMTLLFFSNPGCHACQDIIEAISQSAELQDMIWSDSLAVVCVYIDEELDKWREYHDHYPQDWYVGYDPDLVIRNELLYNVRAIPSLYLLDADKRVILKDADPQRVFQRIFSTES